MLGAALHLARALPSAPPDNGRRRTRSGQLANLFRQFDRSSAGEIDLAGLVALLEFVLAASHCFDARAVGDLQFYSKHIRLHHQHQATQAACEIMSAAAGLDENAAPDGLSVSSLGVSLSQLERAALHCPVLALIGTSLVSRQHEAARDGTTVTLTKDTPAAPAGGELFECRLPAGTAAGTEEEEKEEERKLAARVCGMTVLITSVHRAGLHSEYSLRSHPSSEFEHQQPGTSRPHHHQQQQQQQQQEGDRSPVVRRESHARCSVSGSLPREEPPLLVDNGGGITRRRRYREFAALQSHLLQCATSTKNPSAAGDGLERLVQSFPPARVWSLSADIERERAESLVRWLGVAGWLAEAGEFRGEGKGWLLDFLTAKEPGELEASVVG